MGQRTVELTAIEAQLAQLALELLQAYGAEAARHVGLESRTLCLPDEPHSSNEFVTQGIWA